MPYWNIVTRSFRISWNHKYLWLIALFAGEGGGGYNFSFNQGTLNNGRPPDVSAIQQQVTTWLADHVALIVVLAVIWLLLLIGLFILGAVCEGATVRAAAEHDAERPFGLAWAWRSGVATMWVIVRFRLLIVALGLPLFLLFAGLVIGFIVAVMNQSGGAIVTMVVLALLLAVVGIPYVIYLSFLDRLGARAAVLEQLMARPALVRGHRLLRKRLGRSLLVWLVSIVVSIVLGIVLACFLAIFLVPLFLAGAGLVATKSAALAPFVVLGALVLVPLSLIVGGFIAAQGSTYWTLAFRRLDLEYAPSTGLQYQPPPPQATA